MKQKTPAGPALPRRETLVLYLTKSEVLTFRATTPEKESIFAAAKRYHLTVTEYLVRLHALAEDTVSGKGRTR